MFKQNKLLFFIVSAVITVVLYQNCGSFEANSSGIRSVTSFGAIKCDPSQKPSDTPLRRLNKEEYLNSLRDLLQYGQAPQLVTQVASLSNLIPTDNLGEYTNMDDTISQNHINGYHQMADQIIQYFESNPNVFDNFVNRYANCNQNTTNCLQSFIREFGLRSFRRPLTNEEVQRYADALDSSTDQGFREVVFMFLLSPQFLLHLETDGTPINGDEKSLKLNAYELAARISFTFLKTGPDDTLLNLAESGALQTDQGRTEAIDHIFNNRLADVQSVFRDFYSQWLKTRSFENFQFNPSSAKYDAFLDGASPQIDSMIDEVDQMMNHYAFNTEGSIADLLTSPYSFARTADLAAIYGVPVWNGDTNQMVELPQNERSGLLTRAFFMVSPNEETHPIHRAVFIRRQILCDNILPPPNNLPGEALAPPEHDPSLTTRQRFEAKTSANLCMGCHSTINPVGFAFESYDSIGRHRQFEKVFETDGSFTELPLNTVVEPKIEMRSQQQVNGPVELTGLIAESGRVDACFAKQIWRYTHKRPDRAQDGCSVLDLAETSAGEDGSIIATLKRIVFTDTFVNRYWGNEE